MIALICISTINEILFTALLCMNIPVCLWLEIESPGLSLLSTLPFFVPQIVRVVIHLNSSPKSLSYPCSRKATMHCSETRQQLEHHDRPMLTKMASTRAIEKVAAKLAPDLECFLDRYRRHDQTKVPRFGTSKPLYRGCIEGSDNDEGSNKEDDCAEPAEFFILSVARSVSTPTHGAKPKLSKGRSSSTPCPGQTRNTTTLDLDEENPENLSCSPAYMPKGLKAVQLPSIDGKRRHLELQFLKSERDLEVAVAAVELNDSKTTCNYTASTSSNERGGQSENSKLIIVPDSEGSTIDSSKEMSSLCSLGGDSNHVAGGSGRTKKHRPRCARPKTPPPTNSLSKSASAIPTSPTKPTRTTPIRRHHRRFHSHPIRDAGLVKMTTP